MVKISDKLWKFLSYKIRLLNAGEIIKRRYLNNYVNEKGVDMIEWLPNISLLHPISFGVRYAVEQYINTFNIKNINVYEKGCKIIESIEDRFLGNHKDLRAFTMVSSWPKSFPQIPGENIGITREIKSLIDYVCKKLIPKKIEPMSKALKTSPSIGWPTFERGKNSIPSRLAGLKRFIDIKLPKIKKLKGYPISVVDRVKFCMWKYKNCVQSVYTGAKRYQVDPADDEERPAFTMDKQVKAEKHFNKLPWKKDLKKIYDIASEEFKLHDFQEYCSRRDRIPTGTDSESVPYIISLASLPHHVKHNICRSYNDEGCNSWLQGRTFTKYSPEDLVCISFDISGMETKSNADLVEAVGQSIDALLPEHLQFATENLSDTPVIYRVNSLNDRKKYGPCVITFDNTDVQDMLTSHKNGTCSGSFWTFLFNTIVTTVVLGFLFKRSKLSISVEDIFKDSEGFECFISGDNGFLVFFGNKKKDGFKLLKHLKENNVIFDYKLKLNDLFDINGYNLCYNKYDKSYYFEPAFSSFRRKFFNPEFSFRQGLTGEFKLNPKISNLAKRSYYSTNKAAKLVLDFVDDFFIQEIGVSLTEYVKPDDKEISNYLKMVSKIPSNFLNILEGGLFTGRKETDEKTLMLLIKYGYLKDIFVSLPLKEVKAIISGDIKSSQGLEFKSTKDMINSGGFALN